MHEHHGSGEESAWPIGALLRASNNQPFDDLHLYERDSVVRSAKFQSNFTLRNPAASQIWESSTRAATALLQRQLLSLEPHVPGLVFPERPGDNHLGQVIEAFLAL